MLDINMLHDNCYPTYILEVSLTHMLQNNLPVESSYKGCGIVFRTPIFSPVFISSLPITAVISPRRQ